MKAPLVVAIVIVALVGAVAGFYVYDRFNGGSTSSCGDPASISSHVYNPYRLQIIKSCITASGVVDNIFQEADGDYHVRLASTHNTATSLTTRMTSISTMTWSLR